MVRLRASTAKGTDSCQTAVRLQLWQCLYDPCAQVAQETQAVMRGLGLLGWLGLFTSLLSGLAALDHDVQRQAQCAALSGQGDLAAQNVLVPGLRTVATRLLKLFLFFCAHRGLLGERLSGKKHCKSQNLKTADFL